MNTAKKFFSIFTIAMCFALIFTECTPIASDGGENPSNPGGGSSSGGGSKTVTLTLDLDGGKIGGEATYTLKGKTGDAVTLSSNPVKDRFAFIRWNPNLPAKFPSSNATYKAEYIEIKNNYVVLNLDAQGGNLSNGNTLVGEENDGVTAPQNPTRHGYNFAGWNPPLPAIFSKADDGKNFVAEWVAKEVTLVLRLDGGNIDGRTGEYKIIGKHDEARTEDPHPEKQHYKFANWNTPLPLKFSIDDNNKIFTAMWEYVPAEHIVLRLDTDGGNMSGARELDGKEGTPIPSVATPEKHGYDFAGWTPTIPTKFPSTDATYKATWTAKNVSLVFKTDSGTVYNTLNGKQDETVTAPSNPSKKGYTFNGWSPAVPDKFDIDDNGKEYTAQWVAKSVNLKLSLNGGNIGGSTADYTLTGKHDASVTAPASLAKKGYDLSGWSPELSQKFSVDDEGRSYTAQWQPKEVRLMLDLDGGKIGGGTEKTLIGKHGETVTGADGVARNGYDFAGWYPPLPTKFDIDDYGKTYTAQWNAKNVTLVLYRENGVEYTRLNGKHDGAVTAPAAPTKADYAFVKWNPPLPEKFSVDDTNTYIAEWRYLENDHVVLEFDANGGHLENHTLVGKEGDSVPKGDIGTPDKFGYDFTGWSAAIPDTFPHTNMTFTAGWRAKDVRIVFMLDGGTVYRTLDGKHGDTLTKPADPTKTGYNFTGWDAAVPGSYSIDDNNKVLTATWEAKDITATFSLNGGNINGSTANRPLTGKYGSTLTAPGDIVKNGYTLTGWNPPLPATYTENVTYTAQWEAKDVTIVFKTYGGTVYKTLTGKHGTALTKPADPTRTGYDFKGWDAAVPGTYSIDDNNKVFTATWEAKDVTVTLALNGGNIGGSIANKPLTGKYGTAIIVPQDLARNGYNLTGWSPALPQTFDVADSGKTYTAQWTAISYGITYNLNGGTNPRSAKTAYTINDTTFSLPQPYKNGYMFAGWYENDSFTGSTVTQIATGSTGNRTFWAKWEVEKAAKVIFNGDTTTYDSFYDAWIAANSKTTSSTRRATVVMLKDIDEKPSSYYKVESGKYITLDLNGYTLDRGLTNASPVSDGSVIYINGDLILKDTVGIGKITGGNSNYNGGGGVNVNGSFTMEGGTICKNTSTYGGGVYVNPGLKFSMSGGIICDNNATVCGGGISVYHPVLNGASGYNEISMTGGCITGNTAPQGSGIYLSGTQYGTYDNIFNSVRLHISGNAHIDQNNDIHVGFAYTGTTSSSKRSYITIDSALTYDGIVGRISVNRWDYGKTVILSKKTTSMSFDDFKNLINKFVVTPFENEDGTVTEYTLKARKTTYRINDFNSGEAFEGYLEKQ